MPFPSRSISIRTLLLLLIVTIIGLVSRITVSDAARPENRADQVPRVEQVVAPNILTVGTCQSLAGGAIEVEGTGGSGIQPTGYPTLGAAFAAINAGTHTGVIAIDVCGSTDEGTASAVLNSSGAGSANYTALNIRPLLDGLSISGSIAAGRGVVELNGADNVTIDGDNPLTPGTNRDLTIQNTAVNSVIHGSLIRIALNGTTVPNSEDCTFQNLVLVGNASGRNISSVTGTSTAANASYGIYAGSGASAPTTTPTAISSVTTTVAGAATASNLTIQNNSIANVARAVAIQGAASTVFPGLSIASNAIGNPTAGSADQVYSIGITVQGSTSASIRSNTIYVESFLATSVRGIDVGSLSTSVSGLSIESNRVLRVRNNRPTSTGAFGINLNGGNSHILINNFVADIRNDQTVGGGGFTTVDGAFGIRIFAGNGHQVLHNSVHLFGSVPGTLGQNLTSALVVNGTANSGLNVRNNIFSNQLTGGNPSGIRHTAVYLPSSANSSMNVTWNNNAYYQGSDANSRLAQVGSVLGSGDYLSANFNPGLTTPATNFRSYTSSISGAGTNDNASFATVAAPPFASDTDLHITSSPALNSAGANAGVATDIDGEARTVATPDIGADEFASAPVNTAPTITSSAPTAAVEDVLSTYTPAVTDPDGPGQTWSLLGTHTCGGSIVAGTGVFTFTPAGPVPPASCLLAIQVCDGGSPNLCGQQSATIIIAAVNDTPLAVVDNQNTTINVPLVVNGSVLTSNDSDPEMQSLTVTAVGNAVNGTVGLSAGVVTFTPTAGFTGAASFEYTVSDGALTDVGLVNVTVSGPVFNGAVNVGTGEAITSLTNAGGLFEQMNSGTVSGDVIVNLTSDLSGETGTHALNQLTETGSGGYTVFVRASGAARSIEGSSALGLIRLNGADRITFSGLALGPYGISVRNTGTGPVFRLENDASGNAIRSCSVEGGNADVNSGVILIGDGAALGSGNDNNSITDNRVRDRSDAAGVPANLIRVAGLDGLARNTGTTISNNLLFDYTTSAIVTGFAEDTSINGNTIFQASPRVTVSAISLLESSGTNSVGQNIIRDHTVTSGFVGINMQDAVGTTTIARNRVFEIEHSGAGGGVLQGIHLTGDNAAATVDASNNMLSIAPASATSAVIFGIQDARLQGNGNFVHNSIHVGGTSSGADSHAFLRGIGSTSSILLTDNILFNSRTGGNSFAVGDQSSRAGSWGSDSNLFVGTGTTPSNFFDLGGAAVDFAAWKASPPAQDASSIASVANVGPFNVGNIFASASDLHLRTIGNNPAINAAGPSGVTVDFDGQTRPFNGAPDIGADEVQTATTAAEALISGRVVTLDGRGIRNVRIVVSGGSLPSPRSLVTNAFGYFSIDGLRAGEVYLVSVSGKRFVFNTPARIVSLGEDAFDIDFVGEPR